MAASGLQFPVLAYSEFTLAMVLAPATLPASPNSWAEGGFLGLQDGLTPASLLGISGTAAASTAGWASDGATAGSTGVLDTTPALYVFVASEGFLSVRKNGAQLGVYALPTDWFISLRYISGFVEADSGGAGEVAEVKLYSRPALPQELVVLEADLSAKWGLPYVGPGQLPAVDTWTVSSGLVFTQKGNSTTVMGYQSRDIVLGLTARNKAGALLAGDSRVLSVHEEISGGLVPSRDLFVQIEDPQGRGSVGEWRAGVTIKNGKEVLVPLTWADGLWSGGKVKVPLYLDSKTRKSWPLTVRLIRVV